MVILVTGKAGAGKTHYGRLLVEELKAEGHDAVLLDGDDLRVQDKNQDYSDAGRIRNLTHAAEIAARYEGRGSIVVAAFIAPRKEWRDMMRKKWVKSRVVYVPGGSLWAGTTYERPDDEELTSLSMFVPQAEG